MKNNMRVHIGVFIATLVLIFAIVLGFSNDIANSLTLGLDLQGGFEILYEVSPLQEGGSLPDMTAVVNAVGKRVDILGVSEPDITIEGDDRIRVQLAGITDQEAARQMISATAKLEFRDVNDNLLADSSILEQGGASLGYENGIPVVSLKIQDTQAFGDMTNTLSQNQATGDNYIVTWLDYEEGDSYKAEQVKENQGEEPKYISVAGVTKAIYGDAIIQGNFTEAEAKNLASLINSGSLPVKMTEISSNVVSAEYGIAAFSKTVTAGAVGVALVLLFMIYKYRFTGVLAGVMIVAYIFVVFLVYSSLGAIFTLTGIAALVLGIGMTVDANIITFERIESELYMGRSVKQAVKNGQNYSFSTILDAQVTTLIAGIIMYIFGNGAVKGFATMLIITVLCTLVINVALSRFLLNQVVSSGYLDDKKSWFGVKNDRIPNVKLGEEASYFGPIKARDWMGNAHKAIFVSLGVMSLAILFMVVNTLGGNGALNLGIDFASGTKITVTSDNAITIADVRSEFESLGYTDAKYQTSGSKTVNVTIKESLSVDQLSITKAAFKAKYGIEPNDNVVTPVVGRDLVRDAFFLSILAWIAMLAYITIRFKWDYGISCIVALIHDVLIVLAIFAIFRVEVNIELVSVILAIIGYSINNSIVVFDRIREELAKKNVHKMHADDYKVLVNEAIDNTIIRSLFSSLTTILPVIALLSLGSNAIIVFNIAMFVGLIAGTVSSIYVSPRVWLFIRSHYKPKKKLRNSYREEIDELPVKGINI